MRDDDASAGSGPAAASLDLSADMLDARQPTPLYHQIYLLLRDRIRRGELAPGSILPGEHELARRFSVSRITLKRALNELAAEALVTRHRGRGTVVAGDSVSPVIRGSFDTLIESLRLMGLETEVELMDVQDGAPDDHAAALLELVPGSTVQRATRLRRLQGEPFSHLISYVPSDIAARYDVADLRTEAMLVLLEKAGAVATDAEQWITAANGDPHIASALGVTTDFPLLRIERVMRDAGGRPVQFIQGHYRSDRFQYHLKTQRNGPSHGWQADD